MDSSIAPKILTLTEAADFLRVSTSWLSRHWESVGGVKMAGKILFPGESELYDSIFSINKKEGQRSGKKSKSVAVRLPAQRPEVSKSGLPNQDSREGSRGPEAGGTDSPSDYSSDIYNLLGTD